MTARINTVPAATGRDWATVISLAAIVVAFGAVAGPLGALAGIATALVGYLLGIPYALAAGHVALVVSFPDGIDPLPFVIVEATFIAVLLAPIAWTESPGRITLVAITSALTLAGAAWLVVDSQPIYMAAATVIVLLTSASYGLHRLERVRLGLVPDHEDGKQARQIDTDQTDESTTETNTETTANPTTEPTTDI
ncbi:MULTISPECIES: hypothetical protein [unclassified Natrinema]|uniref:hypothetical protein n=1 Tax=unclassified Natrinema TaxID=2622230 RepID=UPI00026D46C4|nr:MULTISPECIES: hypothetical protein [unclassified Natrinema]AFO59084.1 hypothetical protein NJ7G_3868 [Natrinema sp. J7-2]